MTEQADYVCQVYVTGSQAALLSAACQETIYAAATGESTPEGLLESLVNLRDLFADVAERPTAYPVNGNMARTLKTRFRRMKGPAQRPSRRNKRRR